MSKLSRQLDATEREFESLSSVSTVQLMGVCLHAVTMKQMIDLIMRSLHGGKGGWVVTPNLDILRRAIHDERFRNLISTADLVVADGMPLIWASRLQRTPLPERVAGSSLVVPLAGRAAVEGRSVYLLGGDPGTAEGSCKVLLEQFPELRIAGWQCPPYGFEADPAYMTDLRASLREAKPDIIYVALGSPKQERLIAELRGDLPESWWLGIGISFSFLTGNVRRAPEWMQRNGLEWFHRLCQEPRRLARRYLVDGLPFAVRLFAHSARNRTASVVDAH